MKLQYPQYYRLTRNMLQLVDFFKSDYEDLVENFGQENLFNFEQEVSKLIQKYEFKSRGYLHTYLSEERGRYEKLEEKISKDDINAENLDLFQSMVQDGLSRRRNNNTRRR